MTKKPFLIAHRGNSSEAPENTLSAFRGAIDLGVYWIWIELDIQLSSDNHWVVFHDEWLKRTTNAIRPLKISDLTLEEIKNLDAGHWFHDSFKGEKIPTLKEVFDLPLNGVGLMVEIKVEEETDIPRFATEMEKLYAEFRREPFFENVIFGSFSAPMLKEVLKINPSDRLIGIAEKTKELEAHLENNITHVAISSELATLDRVKDLKARNKEVWVFTVDDKSLAKTLLEYGVDGIITNRPKDLKSLFY